MLSLVLLLGVAVWIAWPLLIGRRDKNLVDAQAARKIEAYRALRERMPESPSAHEALGDALQAAGRAEEAVACYRTALDLEIRAARSGTPLGPGRAAGAGLENKLRLTQDAVRRGRQPAPGETPATRQRICRRCGALCGPQERACGTCGALQPVDRFLDTLRIAPMRREIHQEVAQIMIMFEIILLALYLASWMPIEVKGVLAISTVAVLAFRFLRGIGGD